jgi:hypothetical protein
MNEGFDREFYRPRWQHVLPLGPLGIQPYVRAGRGSGAAAAGSVLRRLGVIFAKLTPGVSALGRRCQNGVAVGEGRRYRPATPCS